MRSIFSEESLKDYLYRQKTEKQILKRINALIKEIKRSPFQNFGKPEPLKHQLRGCWSRRINDEHRLVCEVKNEELRIISCRFHY